MLSEKMFIWLQLVSWVDSCTLLCSLWKVGSFILLLWTCYIRKHLLCSNRSLNSLQIIPLEKLFTINIIPLRIQRVILKRIINKRILPILFRQYSLRPSPSLLNIRLYITKILLSSFDILTYLPTFFNITIIRATLEIDLTLTLWRLHVWSGGLLRKIVLLKRWWVRGSGVLGVVRWWWCFGLLEVEDQRDASL